MLFAACVAVVFGTLLRDDVPGAARLGGRIFVALAGGAYLLGWILYVAFG
jgi:hypothetical protein